jgi:predicted Zn-dependent protease with MMP-like domain
MTGAQARRRRRDRHGRGPRGPLLPADLPGRRTRAERFDDVVLDAVERLERRWGEQLSTIEFAVEDVPPADPGGADRTEVPLGRFFPATRGLRPRVVLYRRPLETRGVDEADLALLVHEVVVEQVASALGLGPEDVDPHYRDDR